MGIFNPGDKITRQNMNYWWDDICTKHRLDPNGVYTVHSCSRSHLICDEWLIAGVNATPENFTRITALTKEEMIDARIKKLYGKCKTTAHWV